MKLKLPNVTYDIAFTPIRDYSYGTCNTSKGEILINNDYPHDQQQQTLIHEMIHAIEGLNVGLEPLTEAQVENISHGFLYIIQRNKQIMKFLQDKEVRK